MADEPGDEPAAGNPEPEPKPRPPARVPVLEAGGDIAAIIPRSFEDVQRVARFVYASGLVPFAFKNPEAVGVAILSGLELGLKPMQALQLISVVNGRPSIYGDGAVSLAMSSGLLADHDEGIEGTGDERVGWCRVERRGMKPITRHFSVEDAKAASLWQTSPTAIRFRGGQRVEVPNDSPWFRYQSRMLVMRARGFAFRDRFADVLHGLPFAEELYQDAAWTDVEPSPVEAAPATGATVVEPPQRESNGQDTAQA